MCRLFWHTVTFLCVSRVNLLESPFFSSISNKGGRRVIFSLKRATERGPCPLRLDTAKDCTIVPSEVSTHMSVPL